jgi:hypothetical protein
MADVNTEGTGSSAAVETAFASGKLTRAMSQQFLAKATGDAPVDNTSQVSLQTEESATSTTKPEDPSTSIPDKRPASETGNEKQEKKAKGSKEEIRLQELLDDLKKAGLTPAELKTFRKEATKTAESSTAKPADVKTAVKAAPVVELKAPVKPKFEEFENLGPDKAWEAFEAAKDKYYDDCREYDRKKAIEDFKRQTAEEAHAQQLNKELAAARERYKDFDTAVAPLWTEIATDKTIHPMVAEFVGQSAAMVDVMYAIGSDAATMKKFLDAARTDPFTALRYAMKAEELAMEELAKTKKEGKAESKPENKGEPEDKKNPANKKTDDEPQPTREVGNRGTGPNDPAADEVRRSQGKLTKTLDDTWKRKAAERYARG